MNLLAVINGQALLSSILTLIVVGVIFWLLVWTIDYIGLPEPINKVARVILVLAVVIILVNFLLGLVGHPFIVW